MKKLLFLILLALSAALSAQTVLPNVSYQAMLNSTCTNANSSCSGAVFVGSGGISSNPGTAGVLGSGSVLDVPVANYTNATITIQGTYSGATINFDFSDNWGGGGVYYFQEVCARTDINLLEGSESPPTNQTRAYQCPVWGAYRFRVRASALTSGAVNVTITLSQVGVDPSLVVAASISNISGASDPCLDVSALKSSAAINLSSATTTQIVAASAGKTIYVCGGSFTIQGSASTAGSVVFETGTQTTNPCDTSTATRTGAFVGFTTAANPSTIMLTGNGTLFSSLSGGQICIVSAGTTVSDQGFISYVQQ